MIIINGVNYYSHEIEAVVEEIVGIEPSFTAATAVRDAGSETDKLAVFFHTYHTDPLERTVVTREVRSRVLTGVGSNPSLSAGGRKGGYPQDCNWQDTARPTAKAFRGRGFSDVLHRQNNLIGNREYTAPRTAWKTQVAECGKTF